MAGKIFKTAAAALTIAALFAGCGSAKESSDSYSGNYTAAEENYAYDGEYGLAEAANYKTEGANVAAEGSVTTDTQSETAEITGDKLVYTGSVTLETLNYEDTIKAVHEHIQKYSGIIEREDSWDGDNTWYYTDGSKRKTNRTSSLTLRVPTKNFQNFIDDMDGAGKITSKSQNVENISRQYNDNSIAIKSLETQQERLLEMMEKAQTVEEMIVIEERLSEVQTELNQKKSWQSSMDTDVMYSTIYLNINEVQVYTPDVEPGIQIDGFGQRLMETIESSGVHFVYFMQNLLLFVVRVAPFAALIGILCAIIGYIRKKKGLPSNPFVRKKKADKQTASNETKTINAGDVKK